jgi:hypothetical protein
LISADVQIYKAIYQYVLSIVLVCAVFNILCYNLVFAYLAVRCLQTSVYVNALNYKISRVVLIVFRENITAAKLEP